MLENAFSLCDSFLAFFALKLLWLSQLYFAKLWLVRCCSCW